MHAQASAPNSSRSVESDLASEMSDSSGSVEEPEKSLTYPHDYRVLFENEFRPTVVGGQAVNLWAIAYLNPDELKQKEYGSDDLDVLQDDRVLKFLEGREDWVVEKRRLLNFADIRLAQARSTAPDGRRLVVEVLHNVPGLDKEDLSPSTLVDHRGIAFNLLDPVALLKSKASNIRKIKDQSKRHDRLHLRMIAECLPLFLSDLVARIDADSQTVAAKTISRLFKTLTDKKLADTLRQEGVDALELIPDLSSAPSEKVRNAYNHQMPLLRAREESALSSYFQILTREIAEAKAKHPALSSEPRQFALVHKKATSGNADARKLLHVVEKVRAASREDEPPPRGAQT